MLLNKTLCNNSSFLVLFKKNNFIAGGSARFLGGTGEKTGLNVEKF